jgi:hypothetical protein
MQSWENQTFASFYNLRSEIFRDFCQKFSIFVQQKYITPNFDKRIQIIVNFKVSENATHVVFCNIYFFDLYNYELPDSAPEIQIKFVFREASDFKTTMKNACQYFLESLESVSYTYRPINSENIKIIEDFEPEIVIQKDIFASLFENPMECCKNLFQILLQWMNKWLRAFNRTLTENDIYDHGVDFTFDDHREHLTHDDVVMYNPPSPPLAPEWDPDWDEDRDYPAGDPLSMTKQLTTDFCKINHDPWNAMFRLITSIDQLT